MTLIILIPVLLSVSIYYSLKLDTRQRFRVAFIHPNYDCKTELSKLSDEVRIKRYLSLSHKVLDDSTDVLLWPENALRNPVLVDNFNNNPMKAILDSSLQNYPKLNLVTGYILFERCWDTVNAIKSNRIYTMHLSNGVPIFMYNTVSNISPLSSNLEYRSKKKIVPIEETIPYYKYLKGIRKFVPSLGGFFFTIAKQDNDIMHTKKGLMFSSLICYESGFGAYISKLTKRGAQVLFFYINEGWYNNITGALLFERMAQLRAIENRRFVVRSSNRGISDVISPKGEVLYSFSEFKPHSYNTDVFAIRENTFYSKCGDVIGLLSVICELLIFVGAIIAKFVKL